MVMRRQIDKAIVLAVLIATAACRTQNVTVQFPAVTTVVVKEPIKPIELSRDGSDSSYTRLFDRSLLFISTGYGISEQRGSIPSGNQRPQRIQ